MLGLAVATVRARRTAFAGSFTALCLGVAILTMSALILLSGDGGVPGRYAGAPVLVQSAQGTGPDGVFLERAPWSARQTKELSRALDAVPGVRRAVPDQSFYAQAVVGGEPVGRQRKGDRLGHGWSGAALAPYRLTAGRAPHRPDEVALDRALGARPGERITLLTAAGTGRFTVSGTVDGPGYYLTDERAAALSGGVRVIGLLTEEGADPSAVATAARSAVRSVAHSVARGAGTVLAGAARSELAPVRDAKTRWIGGQVLTAMGALSAFATVFVVASTFAFSVAGGRRELGLLRAVGATGRQLRRLLYGQALAVGAVGAAAGALLGAALAPALGDVLTDAGFLPPGFAVRRQAWVLAATFAAGLAVALAAVWSASRRAARTGPLEALREAAADDRPMTRARALTGIAFTALGCAAAVGSAFADPTDMTTLALCTAVGLITGVTLLVPAVVPPLVRAVSRPLARRRGAGGMLVREGMLAAVRRTASTTAPVLATVGFVVLITGNTQTSVHSYATRDTVSVRAQAAVVARGGTPGLSDAAAESVPGTGLLATTVYGGAAKTPLEAAGIDPAAFADVHHRLRAVSGSLARLRGPGTMAVTESALATLGGETAVEVTFEDGSTERLRIVAVLSDRTAPTPYTALLPRATVRSHDPTALTDVVHRTGPAASPAALRRLGAEEMSVAAYADRADAEEDRLVEVFTLLLVAMSAGCTGIAVANTLLMSTADRLRDLRLLRLSGATTRQVLGTVAAETTFVVALGSVLGALTALPSLLGIRAGLSGSLGAPVSLVVPAAPVAGAVAGCLVLALAASVLPARAALPKATRVGAG
ncbi:FtsX-like permease family protein [Streptomyces sp. ME19-01-6]|uniref:FtsX-like permease family protein n=1 Tax=Streptomyces sp. ME19-01-6 TaxID=3028686 RepID=UPI0029B53372|nr:FtsX-like permease family protein [Streptomyces sp. ME19-01-6]MDX3226837.1 FtsX-like permease family protein [Streptomyces sp. ME19-01-6]